MTTTAMTNSDIHELSLAEVDAISGASHEVAEAFLIGAGAGALIGGFAGPEGAAVGVLVGGLVGVALYEMR
ncbi:hypothetical protein [Sphingomonas sp. KR3-1]|uniref:hypothetical protein n=1 Tax=Sphingomonas sp. KR3-1 TaxID=3156611 RepID=UPI0032B40E4C